MNLRILKKRSKYAYEFCVKHKIKFSGEFYKAERGESYHEEKVTCKCPKRIKESKRYSVHFWRCEHPLKGTWMNGGMEGYYEPEFSEKTVYGELYELILWGGKPETCNEKEWMLIKRRLGVKEEAIEAIQKWMKQSFENAENYL